MPDGEQCDFFEWSDGQDRSWNNISDFGSMDGSSLTGVGKCNMPPHRGRRGHSGRPGQTPQQLTKAKLKYLAKDTTHD